MIIRPSSSVSMKACSYMAPHSADGFFGSGAFQKFDAVLAMYHDRGLVPFKTLELRYQGQLHGRTPVRSHLAGSRHRFTTLPEKVKPTKSHFATLSIRPSTYCANGPSTTGSMPTRLRSESRRKKEEGGSCLR